MMCSPLVADPYFSAQAAMTHSPSKLALQIGVLRQRRANCDAVSVPRLHHIDRVYRIALEGAGYHTTDSSVHIAASGAGRSAVPSSRRRSGIHLHDVAGDRRAACTGGRSAAREQPREIPRRGNLFNPLLSTMLSKSRTNDLDWLWRRNRDISEQSRRPLGGTKTKMKR
jgi:hypothetical protein